MHYTLTRKFSPSSNFSSFTSTYYLSMAFLALISPLRGAFCTMHGLHMP